MNKYLFKILRYSGLPLLFREFIQRNKVSILMFHDISIKSANLTFSYLSKKYNIIGLDKFIEAIESKDSSQLPKKSLIITFDDGHIRNYDILPILKKYKVPTTIFLCSSIINTNRHYWFKFNNLPLETSQLKLKSTKERLQILSESGFEKDKEFGQPQALQKHHIDEMKSYVNMQSHTMFHPILPNCDDEESKNEIFLSKSNLEQEYGLNINAFAYPNGDYSDREVEFVKKAGYKCGITVDHGFNTIYSDPFRLKRFSSNDTEDINELIVKSSGFWSFFKKVISNARAYFF